MVWKKQVLTGGPPAPTGANESYIIELTRWGITPGLPVKRIEVINSVNVNCYSDADYLIARNNILGMTAAIAWAGNNGYTHVTMPFGSYSLCISKINNIDTDNAIVITSSNMTIDLNGSTFKVMFDSAKRSPYHKMTLDNNATWIPDTGDIFWLSNGGSAVFVIRDCSFTTLRNGKLIGDKIDRDFTVQKEKSHESTNGIAAGGNCKYITVENMDVSFFMGDAITTSRGQNITFVKTGYDMGWTQGTIDATGAFVASTAYCVSDYIVTTPNTPHFLHGYGFTQGMTALRNKKYTVHMYNSSKIYLSSKTLFTMRDFTTTKLTAFVRLVVEEPSVDVNGWQMILKTGFYGNYLTYRNNYIHHNHRGGLTPGVNDMFVINNWFYNNGEEYDYENNLPGFEQESGQPFLTRYHVNMEDTQGFNQQFIGNTFVGGRLGIVVRGYNFIIKNNTFKDCVGISFYRVHHGLVKDNHFDNAGFETYPYDSAYTTYADYVRNWRIEGNIFDGNFNITGNAVITSISNNTFSGMWTSAAVINTFKNNTFKVERDFSFSEHVILKTVPIIDGCTFVKKDQSTVNNSISLEGALLTNCTFKNLKIRVKNVTLKNSIITDSGFDIVDGELKMDGCTTQNGAYLLKNNYPGFPDNSALVYVNHATNPIGVEIRNSNVVSSSTHAIFASANNTQTNAKLKLDNSKITRQVNSRLGIEVFGGALDFADSTISSDQPVPTITPNAALTHRISDCTFTNVSFVMRTSDIQYTKQDIALLARPLSGSGAPSVIPRKVGQEYYDLSAKKLYKAFGTASTNDWIIMN